MDEADRPTERAATRRTFLKAGVMAAGAASVGAYTLADALPAFAAEGTGGRLSRGDAAILHFLAAVEMIEADLWQQYAELGGVQDTELVGLTGGSVPYINALKLLDPDMDQYIHDNTEDEISHFKFINAYLRSKGEEPSDLSGFAKLESSKATGARQVGRLTNLMQLSVETTWYSRYRSRTRNPDLDPKFPFANAVPSLASGRHPAIPRTNDDLTPKDHIQAIANTAAFHFAFIEQGGTSLYPMLAQRVTSPEVLRILLSIGGTEIAHFQTWHDKAGNAVSDPLAPLTDPKNHALSFPNLNNPPRNENVQTNLIMPEPVAFLSRKFPVVSIIRPTETRNAAAGAVKAFVDDGLFINQEKAFFEALNDLAADADRARSEDSV